VLAVRAAARLARPPSRTGRSSGSSIADAGTLADALAAEAQAQAICGATTDHRAATLAFVNKQKPVFEGH
jgi:2-(1,2-epoxy-1,2-dihydrophenyl)acetyl-CoA isomerase